MPVNKREAPERAVLPIIEKENKGTNCNLLVPLVSSRGREVHQPIRYSGCVQLGDIDQDDEEYRPRRHKRSRKMAQPQKVSKIVEGAASKSNTPADANKTDSASKGELAL